MKEERQNKIRNTILILLLVIVVALLIFIFVFNKSNKANIKNDDTKTTAKKEGGRKDISTQDKLVVDIFSKYNSMTDYLDIINYDGVTYFDYFYRNDSIKTSMLDENVKFMITLYNTYGNDLENIETLNDGRKKVDEEAIKLFGSKIDYNKLSSKEHDGKMLVGAFLGHSIMYINNDLNLYTEAAGIGGVTSLDYATKILASYKEDDYLIIENKVLFMYQDAGEDVKVFSTAKDLSDYSNTKNVNSISIIDEVSDYKDVSIDNYIDKLDTFRWTFKKDSSDNYMFYSVEKIK